MSNQNIEKVYNLFKNHKYKTMIEIIKKDPDILNHQINDNKTLIHYAVLTDNKKLIKNIFNIDINQLHHVTQKGISLPQLALDMEYYETFFYLLDKFIETKNEKKIFDNIASNVILKKNFNIYEQFFNKYHSYIDWFSIVDGVSYLYLLINLFYEKSSEIINMTKIIIGDNSKNENYKNLFKYPLDDNSLCFLIYLHYKPEMILKGGEFMTKEYSKFVTDQNIKDFVKLCPEQINYQNQVFKTPIYYISEMNDLNMLKFFVDMGADLNHTSPLGYTNFCHHVMKNSNKEIINYILDLNINFNHIDSNNETPIFNLLRNYNLNIHTKNTQYTTNESKNESKSESTNKSEIDSQNVEIISKLLEKTENWNLQNIYGQTIIHLLTGRQDIEKYYNILKTKYFDINIKNKVGTTPVKIIEKTFMLRKLNKEEIEQKLLEFKELVIDDYIKTVFGLENINIPSEIKNNCVNYKNQDSKKDIICKNYVMNILSKPLLTDIDKLSKNYRDLHLQDYQFAHYNLYNARDSDIYFYYYILIQKYDTLGVPYNNKQIDLPKNNITISFLPKTPNDISNIHYIQSLIANTINYPSLYSINIYWMNQDNYSIPYNLIESVKNSINNGKKYVIARINIIGEMLHANILLIDIENERIIRFEPQGGIAKDNSDKLDELLFELFKKDNFFDSYVYFKPTDFEPINGLQSLSHETDMLNVRKGDINGFCVAWCLWFVEFYIQNVNNKLLSNSNFKLIIPKVIKKLINSGNIISEYIRNYANYMHKKLVSYLTSKSFSYTNIYYDKYTDEEFATLYEHINNEIKNID